LTGKTFSSRRHKQDAIQSIIKSKLIWVWLIAGLSLMAIVTPVNNNIWSLRFLRWYAQSPINKQESGPMAAILTPPPNHLSAARWLVDSGLGSPEASAKLTAAAQNGDPLSRASLGRLYAKAGNTSAALTQWQQVGDLHSITDLAESAWAAGRLEDAAQAYATAWQLDPEKGTRPLARIWDHMDQDREALAFVKSRSYRAGRSRANESHLGL
jgi:hypothetical protein